MSVRLNNYANVTEVHVCGSWHQSVPGSEITVHLSDEDPKVWVCPDRWGKRKNSLERKHLQHTRARTRTHTRTPDVRDE